MTAWNSPKGLSSSSSSSAIPLYQVHGTLPTPCCSGVIVRDSDASGSNGSNHETTTTTTTLQVGQYGQVDWVYTTDMVMNYGRLVGDLNPLHQEWTQGNEPAVIRQNPLVRWISEDDDENDTSGDGPHDINLIPPRPCTTVPVVHGMLVASLFTGILGTLLPGAIYVSQSLEFRQPVYVGDRVTGRVTVVDIRSRAHRPRVHTDTNQKHNTNTNNHNHHTNNTKVIVTCDTHVWVTHSPSSPPGVEQQAREQACIRGQARMLLLPKGVAGSDPDQ